MSLYQALVFGCLQTTALFRQWKQEAKIPTWHKGRKTEEYYEPSYELHNRMSAVWEKVGKAEGVNIYTGYECPQYLAVALSVTEGSPYSWDKVEDMPKAFSRYCLPVDGVERSIKRMASAAAHKRGKKAWAALTRAMKKDLGITLPEGQLLLVRDWS